MLPLSYRCRLFFFFFVMGVTADIISAKEVKGMTTTVQKKPDIEKYITLQSKLQSELGAQNSFNRALLENKLSPIMTRIEELRMKKELKRLQQEMDVEEIREAHDKAMLLLSMEKEKFVMESELAHAKCIEQMREYNIKITELDRKAQLERGSIQLLQEDKNRLQLEVDILQAKIIREKYIQKKPIYLKNPLRKRDNALILSDRCVELNGEITPWKANYIVDKIQYFNNKNSTYPIFIVIGHSPGGSVMAGWNILQAVNHSTAPVYVVIKEYAASMAALITTLASKSYAYPNAMILHHQPFTCRYGSENVREKKEAYEYINEVWKRLGGLVAKKMGISLDNFNKKLYECSSRGAWKEYADNAKKLKWVDYIITGIQDSAISILPNPNDYTFPKYMNEYYGVNGSNGLQPNEEMQKFPLVPYDFDYTYRTDSKG